MGMIGLFSVAGGLDEMVGRNLQAGSRGWWRCSPGPGLPIFSRLPAVWGPEIARVPGVRTGQSRRFGCGPTSSTARRSSALPGSCSEPTFPLGSQLTNQASTQGHRHRRPLSDGGGQRHAQRGRQQVDCRRIPQSDRRHADRRRQRPQDRRGLQLRVAAVGYGTSSSISTRSGEITRFGDESVCAVLYRTDGQRPTARPRHPDSTKLQRAGNRSPGSPRLEPRDPCQAATCSSTCSSACCVNDPADRLSGERVPASGPRRRPVPAQRAKGSHLFRSKFAVPPTGPAGSRTSVRT